jgi:hypothetical protein
MPKPVCFTIMPYGRKPTQAEAGRGPAEIDFNALWDRGYVPVIKQLGYEPVRADQDTGALIISTRGGPSKSPRQSIATRCRLIDRV